MHTLELPWTSPAARPTDFAIVRAPRTRARRVQLHVVGVAFYEDQLARLCRGRKRDGEALRLPARLVLHASENGEADAWVEIEGRMVGTLRRHDALRLGAIPEGGARIRAVPCTAVIDGRHAWEDGRRACHCVRIELPRAVPGARGADAGTPATGPAASAAARS